MGYFSTEDREMIEEMAEQIGKTIHRKSWRSYLGPFLIGLFFLSFLLGLVWAGIDPADFADDDGFATFPRLPDPNKEIVTDHIHDTRILFVLMYGMVGWAVICMTVFYKAPEDTTSYHWD